MLMDNKVVIVSGVGPGLGQANARALARNGATVVLAARNAEYLESVRTEIADAGGSAVAVPTNLTDPDQVAALVARTVEQFGRLDGLVNNAFRMDSFEPAATVDLAKWRKIFEVNVWGTLGLTQACIPHLTTAAAEHGDAAIVFIISMSMRKIRELEGGYSASKAAVHTAAQTLALELGPSRVRVNCVAPGWIGGPNVETYIGWERSYPLLLVEEIAAGSSAVTWSSTSTAQGELTGTGSWAQISGRSVTHNVTATGTDDFRRSIFVKSLRTMPLGVLETFDAPALTPNCEARPVSTASSDPMPSQRPVWGFRRWIGVDRSTWPLPRQGCSQTPSPLPARPSRSLGPAGDAPGPRLST